MTVTAIMEKQPSKVEVWRMFDRIARRYDLLNHLLSLGQDIRWRKKVGRLLPPGEDQFILDLATGTGDQLLYLFKDNQKIKRAVGIDLAKQMLAKGQIKIQKRKLDDQIALVEGNAQDIPYEDMTIELSRRTESEPSRTTRIDARIHLNAKLSPEQKQGVLQAADLCHITNSINEGMQIICTLVGDENG